MQVQVDIGFDELIKLVKQLPSDDWAKLKSEVEKEKDQSEFKFDLENFLLNAPTFNNDQLDEIAKTRKAINQWRIK